MYSSGRHLCPATSRDVENSDSWDYETKALMGNRCLYVAKAGIDDNESTDSEKDVQYRSKKGLRSVTVLCNVYSAVYVHCTVAVRSEYVLSCAEVHTHA